MNDEPKPLAVKAPVAAKMLGVGKSAFYVWAKAKGIKPISCGTYAVEEISHHVAKEVAPRLSSSLLLAGCCLLLVGTVKPAQAQAGSQDKSAIAISTDYSAAKVAAVSVVCLALFSWSLVRFAKDQTEERQ